VYRRASDGRWVAALSYRTETGVRKRRTSYHHSREEADAALVEMKSARNAGKAHHTGKSPKLRTFLVSWLRDLVAVSVGPKTLEGYEVACRVHIIQALGEVRLKDLKARQIQTLYAAKHRAGLSIRTRHNIHATLKRGLKQVVAWGELASSPPRCWTLRGRPPRRERSPRRSRRSPTPRRSGSSPRPARGGTVSGTSTSWPSGLGFVRENFLGSSGRIWISTRTRHPSSSGVRSPSRSVGDLLHPDEEEAPAPQARLARGGRRRPARSARASDGGEGSGIPP
jgi:hypothetical protein